MNFMTHRFAPRTILLDDSRTTGGQNLLFADPVAVFAPTDPDAALEALAEIDAAAARGLWAAGWFSYELGYLFEERLRPRLPPVRDLPLLWFGLYRAPEPLSPQAVTALVAADGASARPGPLDFAMDQAAYAAAFDRVKTLIEAGDIYQANLTFRARFGLNGDPVALYRDLMAKQPVAYGALINTGSHFVLSRSPELFVANRSGTLSTRPMKGTMARGRTLAEDEAGRALLAADPKNRAENLMIVDLLRNDLGRIAEIGSVTVTDLFSVETFASLHQMTSGITARLLPDLSFPNIIAGLFPCGSITGAPKIRAMEIIADLETGPRGLYTGAIGYRAPNRDFCFNVAIRTATINQHGEGIIGAGGGIVADSQAEAEYAEAGLKLKFFTDPHQPLGLIETLLWEPGKGYWLLERHVQRLEQSARYFGLVPGDALAALRAAETGFGATPMRVRLLLDAVSGLSVTAVPLPPTSLPFRFTLAATALDSTNPLLFHKTTRRDVYDLPRQQAAAEHGVDEVVFTNQRGELTEGSITSLFVERDGILLTPPLTAGLLPGVLRAELLATGRAREAVLTPADLAAAEAIFLGNSVRGLLPAQWVRPDPV